MRKMLLAMVTRFRAMSLVRRGMILAVAAALGLVLIGQLRVKSPDLRFSAARTPEAQPFVDEPSAPGLDPYFGGDADKARDLKDGPAAAQESLAGRVSKMASPIPESLPYRAPLIAHSAELAVASKEFGKSRASLEEILERHRGYAAKLRMSGRKTGSVLSATLRVPSSELGATVSDLKSLGDVEQEEQFADEVTQQNADVEARLLNAQATLRRLKELLEKQSYPDGNVRQLQQQIANASAEVNRLEAERAASEHRVTFASVQFAMREVLAPQPEESLTAQLRGAASAGFGEAAASVSALLLFVIGRGPVLLLWGAILFVPARMVWKRLRMERVSEVAAAANG